MKALVKPILIFGIIIALLSTCVFGAQVQISNGDETLEIRIPAAEYIIKNLVGTLHLHVFNKSSGMLMTNDTTSCLLHIYNTSGAHIVEELMGFDDNLVDFKFDINSSIFTSPGLYSYIVGCNTSTNGGFIAGGVTVTKDGFEPQDNSHGWAIITLLGVAFLFAMASFKIDSEVLKALFFFIMMLFIVITLSLAVSLPNISSNITNTLEIGYLIAVVITIFAFMYTIIIFIYEALINKKAEERREQEG